MSSTPDAVPDPQVPAKARSRRYTAAYKARILAEYEALDKAGKGALLRREGLYTSLISAWRQQRDQAGLAALATPAGPAAGGSAGQGDRPAAQGERASGR